MEGNDEERSVGSVGNEEEESISMPDEELSVISFGEEGSIGLSDEELSVISFNEEGIIGLSDDERSVDSNEFTEADAQMAYENILDDLNQCPPTAFFHLEILRKPTFDVILRNIDTFCTALSGIESMELRFGGFYTLDSDFGWSSLVVNDHTHEAWSKLGRALLHGVTVDTLVLDCFSLNAEFVALILQSLPKVKEEVVLNLPVHMSNEYAEGFHSIIYAVSNHPCTKFALNLCEDTDGGPSSFGTPVSQLLSSDGDKQYDLNIKAYIFSLQDCRALGRVLANNQGNIVWLLTIHANFQDGGIGIVADAFRSNTTVRTLSVNVDFWDPLSAPLRHNSTIKNLSIYDVTNASQFEEIIEGISESNVEELDVSGRSGGFLVNGELRRYPDEATRQKLLSILQKNYTLKSIGVFGSVGGFGSVSEMQPFKVLTDLNRAGRGYLQEDAASKSKGVAVVANVNEEVGSVYFHLRENPGVFSCSDNMDRSSRHNTDGQS